jgi:uncharacterized protein
MTLSPSLRDISYSTIVIQPTSGCNLNCSYCYLPDRDNPRYLSSEVLQSLIETVSQRSNPVMILWHGGEPLSAGLGRMNNYLSPFTEYVNAGLVRHQIQTNGTLISERWIDIFAKERIQIGVSLDGRPEDSGQRVDWRGKESHERALRGIRLLNSRDYPFTIICVVNDSNINHPRELLEFLANLGPRSISFNIVEAEGLNVRGGIPAHSRVERFWQSLWNVWTSDVELMKKVSIRQFRDSIVQIRRYRYSNGEPLDRPLNPYPTVAWNGDVVLFSPELHSAGDDVAQFIVGNVKDTDLDSIVADGMKSKYVTDFIKGRESCQNECSLFDFCGGGQASNKWFENRDLASTSTQYCRNSRFIPAATVIKSVVGISTSELTIG